MTLKEYWEDFKPDPVKFMAATGIKTPATLSRYINQRRRPRDPDVIEAIKVATGNRVTANDFYGAA